MSEEAITKYELEDRTFKLFKSLDLFNGLRGLFYETTGLGLSFYSSSSGAYDYYPKKEKSKYCKLIQSIIGMEACLKSDHDALDTAYRNGEYCMYKCHAGLINVVVPLVFRGEVLGAMYAGQVVTEPHSEEAFKSILSHLLLTKQQQEKLYSYYARIKHVDRDKLLHVIKLSMFMSNYIISVENERFLQNEVFKREQRILQFENYRMQVENAMQNLSIKVLQDQVMHDIEANQPAYEQKRKVAAINRAIEVIHRAYKHKLTVAEIAQAVYFSPNYFSSVFNEVTGKSFKNFLTEIRVTEGKRLLVETETPIKEIAQIVGFEDYNYFNKVFKCVTGSPPAAFRKSQASAP